MSVVSAISKPITPLTDQALDEIKAKAVCYHGTALHQYLTTNLRKERWNIKY